ncbi:MAG: 5-dehydro-4-deoxy-D-glucuronate isomerase [Prolixibacteraceae bacterium]|nr:5-dehydro-4-deoxy-D-glucuronate isomerase [Prolixibacteraceae bacterium]
MTIKSNSRYAVHPEDFKRYDTERIRKEFLVEEVMVDDQISLTYSKYDRYIVGGAVPKTKALELDPIDSLKADYFLQRREMGIINVGGPGKVETEKETFELGYKDALYLGRGTKKVVFKSDDKNDPARFYINSAPAHKEYQCKRVTLGDANILEKGSLQTSNERKINQLLINQLVDTCQLQMGMTELEEGSVWNTMPVHTHDRRMEAYFYFEVPKGQAVCHFMGQTDETRHIWMKNEQAVLSPSWSIHSAAGTSNYIFIWGMAGENLDYGDMDVCQPDELR